MVKIQRLEEGDKEFADLWRKFGKKKEPDAFFELSDKYTSESDTATCGPRAVSSRTFYWNPKTDVVIKVAPLEGKVVGRSEQLQQVRDLTETTFGIAPCLVSVPAPILRRIPVRACTRARVRRVHVTHASTHPHTRVCTHKNHRLHQ